MKTMIRLSYSLLPGQQLIGFQDQVCCKALIPDTPENNAAIDGMMACVLAGDTYAQVDAWPVPIAKD